MSPQAVAIRRREFRAARIRSFAYNSRVPFTSEATNDENRSTLAGAALYIVAVSALVAATVPGCGSDQGPITSQTTKYEADDASDRARAALGPAPRRDSAPGSGPAAGRFTDCGRRGPAATDVGGTAIPMPPGGSPTEPPSAQPAATPRSAAGGASRSGGLVGVPVDPSTPSVNPAAGPNPYKASGQTPEELLASLQQLSSQQPQGTTRAAAMADYQNVQRAVLEGAERLLAMPGDVRSQQMAAEYKVRALTMLAQLGDSEAPKALDGFCDELKKSPTPELSRLGRRLDFAGKLQDFAAEQNPDAQGLLRDFRSLFGEEDKDAGTLAFGDEVARILEGQDSPQKRWRSLKQS